MSVAPGPKKQPLKITLIYFCIGILWILFSDKLVDLFIREHSTILLFSILKGCFFVLSTSAVIYFLISASMKKLEESNESLNESNLLIKSIIESSPEVIIFALDKNYRYQAFNKKHKDAIKTMCGRDIEIGMSMLDAMSGVYGSAEIREVFDRVLSGESFNEMMDYSGL
ncbi:MAG: hypothetical protein HGA22_03910, partial [Clostridiales bacterium]|nr:hypothetical protein [Clostridiales bacterium]